MDRNDYKAIIREAKDLIKDGNKEDALDLLDGANWRKIRNVNALIEVSELYEQIGHIEDSKDLLLIAHERSPIGRMILYHLSLVCIKTGSIDEADEYYEEFVKIAPHDSMKYIIRFNLAKARNCSENDLIRILEEFKESDFREDWAFELAYLYRKTAQADKCIALCDEIILWFGEGPYVEKALELKMLYSPLTEEQEEKYRKFQQDKKGYTHFKANEMLESGEIIRHDIAIPPIQEEPEHFNTINLQAEIKRNIDEIMEATEEGEVSENLENIKELLEDIPYLQVKEQEDDVDKKKEEGKKIDDSLKNIFEELLIEEQDGQISLKVEEDSEEESQIEGQMTIQDVMDNWAKTQRAAEAALDSVAEIKLQNVKEQAIEEANSIMDKLSDVKPRLDAGENPTDIMKEEILAEKPEEVIKKEAEKEATESKLEDVKNEESVKESKLEDVINEESVKEFKPEKSIDIEEKKFTLPKVSSSGEDDGVGVEIPIVSSDDSNKKQIDSTKKIKEVSKEAKNISQWKPPVLSEEKIEKASKIVEELNESMQKSIDKLSADSIQGTKIQEVVNEEINKIKNEASKEPKKDSSDNKSKISEDKNNRIKYEPKLEEITDELDLSPEVDIPEVKRMPSNWESAKTQVLPNITINNITKEYEEESKQDDSEILAEAKTSNMSLNEELFKSGEPSDEEEEEVLKEVDKDEVKEEQFAVLTQKEKEIFSYFMPIQGMEDKLCEVLDKARNGLLDSDNHTGNVIVQGMPGSGKTMLATNIVKVLQSQIDKPKGNVGVIDGDKLNGKDLNTLFSKIKGGCLIIEKAGEISRETAVRFSLMMENDMSNVLIVLEDSKVGIERITASCPELIKKFSEKIIIPPFTIDELVNFARTYASECECVIDEMGILALYDRINIIQSLDHPTAIAEVKDILDEAMENADRGGFKMALSRIGTKKYDENGFMILREQDFQI